MGSRSSSPRTARVPNRSVTFPEPAADPGEDTRADDAAPTDETGSLLQVPFDNPQQAWGPGGKPRCNDCSSQRVSKQCANKRCKHCCVKCEFSGQCNYHVRQASAAARKLVRAAGEEAEQMWAPMQVAAAPLQVAAAAPAPAQAGGFMAMMMSAVATQPQPSIGAFNL
jgi:hypothetical protein